VISCWFKKRRKEGKKERSRMKKVGRGLLLISAAAAGVTTVQAQSAQVSGQAVDTSQAAVWGAKIILTRVETGDQRDNSSGNEGYYAFPLLLPGHYPGCAKFCSETFGNFASADNLFSFRSMLFRTRNYLKTLLQ
jgi:hypothetical protein